MKHLLSIEALSAQDITDMVNLGVELKKHRNQTPKVLDGQVWALIFNKSSTRTRVSFEVGIRELGGDVIFLSGADSQIGRGEPVKDTARVLGRMVHGAVIRTYAQSDVEEFAEFSKLPTINALTDEEHPCQILADLQLMKERLGGWKGKKVCFLGDGDCNVAKSWMWAAARLGFELTIGAPKEFQPPQTFMDKLGVDNVKLFDDPSQAVDGADVVYTDVWVSMGKEEESAGRIQTMQPYQINPGLMQHAAPGAIVMHCLPAYRGKEITAEVLEEHAEVIFSEAENRLHAQKAVILWMLGHTSLLG
ncbi:ornithine carbamoyltransferase [Phragmitibacter flavus]|uniref:Ornithine carbamoyltransferase n=1 Tax=Phragmitibacter flavus TaxID=2576071 RepID=A0A5R8KL78_9BACT|nr:ornithine carbamoyltransferase [Phragmitibacter flavus]TLD72765.1 ornithine carbamoyltransferase [Phragmitibacter flavus]